MILSHQTRVEDTKPAGGSPAATRVRYWVMVWLTLAAALSYLVRGAVGVAESTIRRELSLTLDQSGWFMSAFFFSYALFQVPCGQWSHRVGSRQSLSCYAVAWSVAACMLALADGLSTLIAAQILMGIAQAGVFPAACNSIAKWMPLSQRSLSCAILATGMQVGAILASLLTGMWLESVGWRWLFLLYALPGFVWSLWFAWRFRDEPENDRKANAAECQLIRVHGDQAPQAQRAAGPTPWLVLLGNGSFWFLCGQQICRASGYMFFASWFPTFLQKTRDVSVNESGSLQALIFTGTLVGSLCGGMVTDAIWRRSGSLRFSRSGVGALALGSCGLLILAAWFVDSIGVAVLLLTLGAFCAALAGPCAFAAAIDIGGRHVPQVFGVMNMAGNLAAAACPILVAWLFDWTADWNLVLLLFALIYLAGAISWLMVDSSQRLQAAELRCAES